MKVFICWSNEASHMLAKILKDWLPVVLERRVEPFISSDDIGKGRRWSPDLSAELEASNFGIVCFLPDNLDNVWMHFEAGALSKSISDGRVVPFLLGVSQEQIRGPLDHESLNNSFDTCWTNLKSRVEEIDIPNPTREVPSAAEKLSVSDGELEVLRVMAAQPHVGFSVGEIAAATKVNEVRTQHYLDGLWDRQFIEGDNDRGDTEYSLGNLGRAILVKMAIV